jgi:hypothetical protein
MPIDFTLALAEYKELSIELRDDVQRSRGACTIATLATVMGPALLAGEETEAFEAKLREDSILTQMITDGSVSIYPRIIELATQHCQQSRINLLAEITRLLDDGFINPQQSKADKTDCTIVKLEAKSKELLNEAEAKANIISRKRADILSVFDASMKIVTDNSRKIQTFDTRLADLATELATKMDDKSLDNDQICVQITKINTAQKAFQSQKELTLKTIIEHFGESMTLGRSKTTDLVALTIPDNIEAGKGTALMENLTLYLAGRSDHYYALMPYIQRIISDYDPVTGMCYKPPDIIEELHDIPLELRPAYATQAKLLYNTLISKLTANVKRLVKSTFQYGLNDDTALCHEHDGPTALFSLICMFRPCTMEYTEKIESALYDAHKGFNSKGNVRKHIKHLRSVLLEASDLGIDLKWQQSGKPIVDIMTHKDHNMADALKTWKSAIISDKNTLAELDKLFAAIESQCKKDEQYDDKHGGGDHKHANSAKGGGKGYQGRNDSNPKKNNDCRKGDDCTRPDCYFTHPRDSKSKGGDHKASKTQNGVTKCEGKGCNNNTPADNRILCQSCYNKARESSTGTLELKNGQKPFQFKPRNALGLNKTEAKEIKKAFKAFTADQDQDQDDEPGDQPPGPLSSKRKVTFQPQGSDKKSKSEADNVKAFAAAIGIKLQ